MRFKSVEEVEDVIRTKNQWFTIAELTNDLYPNATKGEVGIYRNSVSRRMQQLKKQGKIQPCGPKEPRTVYWRIV